MKNIKKTFSSNFDLIMTVGITFLIILAAFLCVRLYQQDKNQIPTTNFNYENYTEDTQIDYLNFDMSCVIDLCYLQRQHKYTIEYDDPDIFDYEYLADLQNTTVKDYVILEASKEVFYTLINDYNLSIEEKLDITFNQKYVIKRVYTTTNSQVSISYYLILNPEHAL